MQAKIYRFPESRAIFKGYKIPLYNEDEILLTVMALNIFADLPEKVTENTLVNYDPLTVIKALVEAKSSTLLSTKTRTTIANILKSIESL
jgi:hypothetical protein